jgi:hypothetical protein
MGDLGAAEALPQTAGCFTASKQMLLLVCCPLPVPSAVSCTLPGGAAAADGDVSVLIIAEAWPAIFSSDLPEPPRRMNPASVPLLRLWILVPALA